MNDLLRTLEKESESEEIGLGTIKWQPILISISKLQKFQYNAALATTGAIKYTSHCKCYKELGLEFLESRRKLRRLYVLHNTTSSGLPAYLYQSIPKNSSMDK